MIIGHHTHIQTRVRDLMPSKGPQNPVFAVNPMALEVCRPKVHCPSCGTVFPVRHRQLARSVRCPSCQVLFRLTADGNGLPPEDTALPTEPAS